MTLCTHFLSHQRCQLYAIHKLLDLRKSWLPITVWSILNFLSRILIIYELKNEKITNLKVTEIQITGDFEICEEVQFPSLVVGFTLQATTMLEMHNFESVNP